MLRFKRDDGTSYAEWGSNRITEVAETYIGLVTTMTAHYVPDGIPLIRNSDIKENKFVFKDPIYLDNEFAEENKTRAHELGDIVTVHTGDVGTSAVINQELEGSIGFATIVTRIIDKEKNIPQFVCWYYNSPKNKKIVINLITGDGRNNLNMRDFNKLVIPIPCSEEQQKIADFLSEVDNIIAASEQEIESLELQKKGAMQKIFSQEVRFKADDGSKYPEWEEKLIKDLTTFHKQGYYTKEDYVNSGIKLARVSDLYNPRIDFDSMPMIEMTEKDYESFKISSGDFLIARSGSIGRYGIVTNIPEKTRVVFGSFIIKFNFDNKILDTRYFGEFYNSNFASRQLRKIIQTGANININAENIKSLKIPLPCLEEQQKIVDFLSEFDNAIEYAKEELEVWKNIKKGLLQQMFE